MRCPTLIAVLTTVLCLEMACPVVHTQNALPGSILHLNASKQNQRDKAWKNLGLGGGELPPNDATPDLKDGTIKIPDAGFNRKLRWYSVGARGEGFAGKPDLTPDLKLKDWTAEFLVKRNGPKWPDLVVATQFAGFHSRDRKSQGFEFFCMAPIPENLLLGLRGKTRLRAAGTRRKNWDFDIEKEIGTG